ncbi:uncharacterized protein LOC135369904 isoform X2 [Ornithodoros turicata]|uniref:uncharacterized protein LOC135369904 isoform X2 n=1 Tax=Ornithodoros turicata TaxID=34597 RepID=UPI003139DDB9
MEEDIQLGEEGGPSPPLDHGAQKARSVLSHKGSLGKRRKPSRESIHTFLTSVSWNGTADDVTSGRGANGRHVTKTVVNLSDLNGAPKSTKVQISAPKMAAETKPAQHTPRVTTVHIKGTTVSSTDQKTQPSPRARRFILDVETTKHLLHRRDPSLDSGCSLDLSCSDAAQDSASSGKGSPDPGLAGPRTAQLVGDEALSPPAEFADSPTLPRHKETEKGGSPDVREVSTRESRAEDNKHAQLGRASSLGPPSPGIRVNFRILPRADGDTVPTSKPPPAAPPTAAPPTPRSNSVGRSESLRVGGLQTWDHRRPPKLDPERRCRSLSRATSATPDEQPQQPEWMHIARQKQNARVDWENFEANMKEPHSISCTNLSESHMRDRVVVPAPGQKPLLTRSVSAVYPRIKMSRFERRMRKDNRNPSPERKLSDDFNIVSDSTQSSGTTSSSTEDEKPPFLNVQLRHVEKTPPLNVVFQTSRPGETASPASPRRLLRSPFGEECDGSGLPRPQKKKETSRVDDGLAEKEVKQQGREKVPTASQFLQPKRVEVIEGQREGARSANDVPPRIRSPTNLKRSASVQMRPKLRDSGFSRRLSPRPKPELEAATEDAPSWVQEAQRKRNSGIDWDRLDKSLSETPKHDGVSVSTECLHKPITTTEPPVWVKEIQKRKDENTRHRTHRLSGEFGDDESTLPKTRQAEAPQQNDYKSDTGKASPREYLTVETTTVVPAKDRTGENSILKTSHTSTHSALSEPGDNAPRIVDVQPKEPPRADRMATVESRSKFLDEIFSEAEGTEDELPTKASCTADSLAPSRESEDSSDSEKHTRKQALMEELKCLLKKRSSPQSVADHKRPGATTPDKPLSTPQTESKPQFQGDSTLTQNGHSVPEDTFPKPSEGQRNANAWQRSLSRGSADG